MIAESDIAGRMFEGVTGLSTALALPTLHQAQAQVDREAARYNVLVCGRRWGKDVLARQKVAELVGKWPVAWYEPTYKSLAEAWREAKKLLQPITSRSSETEHRIECTGGGSLDMWTLDNPDSSRGRKYRRVIVNEAAMVRYLQPAWTETIRPTLTDYQGDAWFTSTPKGRNFFWQLYTHGSDSIRQGQGWRAWQYPTSTNPYIVPAEIEAARDSMPMRAFSQEYLAEFLEDSSGVFRGVYDCIDTGRDTADSRVAWQRYTLGVDLGRVNDFTVLIVFDSSGRQAYFERFNLISWERQIAAIQAVYRLYQPESVWLDSTGIGDPLIEMCQSKGIAAQGYHLTIQSKTALIDSYAMSIERGQVRLMDLPVQTNELIGYEYEQTAAGNVRMNAPLGGHDDTVIAGALANHGLRMRGFTAAGRPIVEEFDPGRRLVPGEADEDKDPRDEFEILRIE